MARIFEQWNQYIDFRSMIQYIIKMNWKQKYCLHFVWTGKRKIWIFLTRKRRGREKLKIYILNCTKNVIRSRIVKTMIKLEMRSEKGSIATKVQIWLWWEISKFREWKFFYLFFSSKDWVICLTWRVGNVTEGVPHCGKRAQWPTLGNRK